MMRIAQKINQLQALLNADHQRKAAISRQTVMAAAMIGVAGFALMPSIAAAAPWDSAAQQVINIFTSGFARLIAIIAVTACGVAALAGKLSWDWAIKIILGIVLMFGAPTIVSYFSGAIS